MENVTEIVKHKLAEKGIDIAQCNIQNVMANSGTVGKENAFLFPLRVHDNMVITGQSGCIFIEESNDYPSLMQLPLLWGRGTFQNRMSSMIPFLLIQVSK